MAVQLEPIQWTDQRSIAEIIDDAKRRGTNYLVISGGADAVSADTIQQSIEKNSSFDVIALVDTNDPARDPGLTQLLPPVVSFIAAKPDRDPAIVISVEALASQMRECSLSQSLVESIVELAEDCTVAFVEVTGTAACKYAVPHLTAPEAPPQAEWLRRMIQQVQVTNAKPVALTALRAGLYLLNDFADESHSCSQSIEGEGRNHTGDYWHAILHRREPDYGNSKYWFRRVGRHPIFAKLANSIEPERLGTTTERRTQQRRDQVAANGAWAPFAFVDLCAAAEDDRNLKEWCERVQYQEMLLLLEQSYREATGLESA